MMVTPGREYKLPRRCPQSNRAGGQPRDGVILVFRSARQPGIGKPPEAALLMQGRWRRWCGRRLLMPWDVQLRGFRVVTVIW